MEILQEYYIIITYNVGLISALLYIIFRSLKANKGYQDRDIFGIMLAAFIWPAMIIINVIAVVFRFMQYNINHLVKLPAKNSLEIPIFEEDKLIGADEIKVVSLNQTLNTSKG